MLFLYYIHLANNGLRTGHFQTFAPSTTVRAGPRLPLAHRAPIGTARSIVS